MKLELCIDSFAEAVIAHHYHFDRIELCSALSIGGITPSAGLIQKCSSIAGIETHVMIRPRGGNFVYSSDELKIMQKDIHIAAELGANGVVFGMLDRFDQINIAANRILIKIAQSFNLNTTFHRAFDLVKNPNKSLMEIIDLGFDRILTSGKQQKAIDGIKKIEDLLEHANGKIQIMAGSGINADNARQFQNIGIDALHFTARKLKSEKSLEMGKSYSPDTSKIEGVLNALKS